METTINLKEFTYQGKVVGHGLALGQRRGLWELKKYKKPLWARIEGGSFVSKVTSHKKDIDIYIPGAVLLDAKKRNKSIMINDCGEIRGITITRIDSFSVDIEQDREERAATEATPVVDLPVVPTFYEEFSEAIGIESTIISEG